MALCECGCGGEAKPRRRFIKGHQSKGKKFPKEVAQKTLDRLMDSKDKITLKKEGEP